MYKVNNKNIRTTSLAGVFNVNLEYAAFEQLNVSWIDASKTNFEAIENCLKKNWIFICTCFKGVSRTLSHIYDGAVSKNSEWLFAVNYFPKNASSKTFDKILNTPLCFIFLYSVQKQRLLTR